MQGRPPAELSKHGKWRRRCRKCRTEYIESYAERCPEVCACGAPLRARVQLTLLRTED